MRQPRQSWVPLCVGYHPSGSPLNPAAQDIHCLLPGGQWTEADSEEAPYLETEKEMDMVAMAAVAVAFPSSDPRSLGSCQNSCEWAAHSSGLPMLYHRISSMPSACACVGALSEVHGCRGNHAPSRSASSHGNNDASWVEQRGYCLPHTSRSSSLIPYRAVSATSVECYPKTAAELDERKGLG